MWLSVSVASSLKRARPLDVSRFGVAEGTQRQGAGRPAAAL
ncbi:MAG: hypothetical protein U0326_43870 [Polyangiales bacterium]